MDIIIAIFKIVGVLLAVGIALIILVFAFAALPAILGFVGCVHLWRSCHSNLGVLLLIVSIALEYWVWCPYVLRPVMEFIEKMMRGPGGGGDGTSEKTDASTGTLTDKA